MTNIRIITQWAILWLVICYSTILAAEPANRYLDFSMGYSRGDYGTGQVSSLSQLQLTYGHVLNNYDYSITAPYLFLSDEYGDDNGPGDITLRGGIKTGGETSQNDSLYGSIAVKIPTADDKKGMGTGEADVGVFVTYTHYFNDAQISLHGGYIMTGDSANQTYKDIAVYGISMAKMIIPWYVYAGLNGSQQTLATGDDPLEMSAGFYYQLEPTLFIRAEAMLGLNNASPDHGITIGLVNWF